MKTAPTGEESDAQAARAGEVAMRLCREPGIVTNTSYVVIQGERIGGFAYVEAKLGQITEDAYATLLAFAKREDCRVTLGGTDDLHVAGTNVRLWIGREEA